MTYYNENDPKAAAWLRELIRAGVIPPGDVDSRSVLEVKPHELTAYSQQHFFAGIGGWALALKLAGWPDDKPVRTGSCPCQPFSQSGKRLGTKDERHLWPVFRDLIAFGESTVTFGEQVASPLGRDWLAGIRADLEGLGYEVGASDLCAACVGAPHIRQRLYWVAHANSRGLNSRGRNKSEAQEQEKRNSQPEQRGGTGRVADTGHKREGWSAASCQTQGWRSFSQSSGCGTAGGLANTNGGESWHGELQPGRRLLQQPENETALRVGDSDQPRPQGRVKRGDGANQWTPWAASVALACTDGKSRRIEPGSFPLAHGVPGRVGLLRGYGNAIVPQLAAEFIQAACESFR